MAFVVVPEPVFSSPAGIVFNQVKPDKTADFELVVKRVAAALRASRDPARRQLGAGWKAYKAEEPYQGMALYVFVMDPATPAADYSLTRLLAEEAPADVQDLATKFQNACVSQSLWNLTPLKTSD